jgi:hypothetical protein
MAIPLGKPSDKADRPNKPSPFGLLAKCGVCVVALLGVVVLTTTFVARLASIRILLATQSTEDLIRGSLAPENKTQRGIALRFRRSECGIIAFRLERLPVPRPVFPGW